MSNISIFKQDIPESSRAAEGISELTKSLVGTNASRRISTRGNKFRKVVGGEEVSKLNTSELNVVIIHTLPKVSRQFYEKEYDPNAAATLPDCWSNLGDFPDKSASNPQASSCVSCPQNIEGSGKRGGRACRFVRRVAVLLEGDPSGELYQMNFASKSLFGKGEGNTHPFESYIKFLAGNNKSIDRVVTEVSLDPDSDVAVCKFTALRHMTDEELDLAKAASQQPEAQNMVRLTAAQQDGVKKLPASLPPQAQQAKPEVVAAPVDTEVEPDAPVEPPVKRASKKPEVPAAAPKKNLADVVSAWSSN
jgi:hypothetical protein